MASDSPTAPASKGMYWVGWVLSVLPALLLCFSAYSKLSPPPDFEKQLAPMGWSASVMPALGIVELACTILYLIPQTAVLGAILLTGYLGGATATHVRIADWGHFWVPVVLGIVVWLGIALRDGRLWSLIPLRR
jgi:DoxX-like protein